MLKKKMFSDLIINTIAFGIYMIAQQIILMPILNKLVTEEQFTIFVMFFSVFSIMSNSFGSQLGIVRQIREEYNENKVYNKKLIQTLIFVLVSSFVILIIIGFNIINSFILSTVIVLANIRLYCAAYFRMNKKFKKNLIQNIIYLLSLILGIVIFYFYRQMWIPYLVAEILTNIYSIKKTDLKDFRIKDLKITKNNKKIDTSFKDYSTIELLVNVSTYFDKIIIYPILGSNSVNIYYVASTVSKMMSLIINPMQGVIISWIEKNNEETKNNIVRIIFKYSLPIIIITALLNIPISYITIKILYPNYLVESMKIIIPISIAVGFTTAYSVVRSAMVKFIDSKIILKSYVRYIIIFIVLAIILSKQFNLIGFSYAITISKIVLFSEMIYILQKTK